MNNQPIGSLEQEIVKFMAKDGQAKHGFGGFIKMEDGKRKIITILVTVFMVAGVIPFLFLLITKGSHAPNPGTMPPVVEESMGSILQSLEYELAKHSPEIFESLQPGITLEELDQAEAILGQALHPEMQELYSWHNGLTNDEELIPGHGFWDLESAIQANQAFQKKGITFLLPHERNWLTLFPDAAGDGYYYDPKRKYDTGGIFYNFREVGYYRYFPSIKNLLTAIIECYQNGAYPQNTEPNYELEEQIMNKYGVEYEQQ